VRVVFIMSTMQQKRPPAATKRRISELSEEIRRVEMALDRIATKIHDPERDLANTVRLSVSLRELQAYLCGIRFAMGDEAISEELMDPAYLKPSA
jgi:hypothetical protein